MAAHGTYILRRGAGLVFRRRVPSCAARVAPRRVQRMGPVHRDRRLEDHQPVASGPGSRRERRQPPGTGL